MKSFAHRALLTDGNSANGLAHRLSLPGLPDQLPTLIGSIENLTAAQTAHWLAFMRHGGERDGEEERLSLQEL